MSSKDPKDMTASELLRWAAKDITENFLGGIEAIDCIRKTVGSKEKISYGADLANALEVVADKIDADVEAARREVSEGRFFKTLDTLIEAHGYPSRRAGEVFGEWIGRCFIPRPCDEAGEPVQFGDRDIDWDNVGEHRDGRIRWCASAVDSKNRLYATTSHKEIVAVAKVDANGRVKRPAPEVLGADGLPVVEGETAWDMASGLEIVVSRIAKDEGGNVIVCANGDICELQFAPKNLTHTPLDNQARINTDAVKTVADYWGCYGVCCEDCPAKIDGEKPHVRYSVNNCECAKAFDLLRRQRELDARKGGE